MDDRIMVETSSALPGEHGRYKCRTAHEEFYRMKNSGRRPAAAVAVKV